METHDKLPSTLMEAVRYFADLDRCEDLMIETKWPNRIVTCPECGGCEVGRIKSRRKFQCKAKDCRRQFSTKVGTIFEDSPLGLDKWFVGIWCLANMKNGVSSHELGRSLGISQKSAWHLLHRARLAQKTKSFEKIRGDVESDESFIGGKSKNMHKSRRLKLKGTGWIGKQIVHGLLERGSEVRAQVITDTRRHTMHKLVKENVEPGSTVHTDALASYVGLNPEFVHRMVDHAKAYVEGTCHTNNLECFWSLLKRSIRGTYVWVSPEHLQAYLDEQCHRYNTRKISDRARFLDVLRGTVGKRLTMQELKNREAVA